MRNQLRNRLIGASVACGLLLSSTAAGAAATNYAPPPSINPMIALSVFGSYTSAVVYCGLAASVAQGYGPNGDVKVANEGNAQQVDQSEATMGSGKCVFPVTDAVSVPVAVATPAAKSEFGFILGPLLAAIVAAGGAAALASGGSSGNEPVSPS